MEIVIHGSHVTIPDRTKAAITKRVETSFKRLADHISRVHVTLGDINGPKGGVDKTCRVQAEGFEFPPIVADERDSVLTAAINRAVAKVKNNLARQIERRRDKRLHVLQSRGLKRKALDRAAAAAAEPLPTAPIVKKAAKKTAKKTAKKK